MENDVRVIASTVVRESKVGMQLTGSIYEIAWPSGEVVANLPVPDPRQPATSDNPRGGTRGGRGIAATPEGIVVANNDTLYVYDRSWALLRTIEHPLFLGLHEIAFDGEALFLSATSIDAVIRVGAGDQVSVAWDPHDAKTRDLIRIPPRHHPLDPTSNELPAQIDECHLNGVSIFEGNLVVNCGKVRRYPSWTRRASLKAQRFLVRVRLRDRKRINPSRCVVVQIMSDGASQLLLELDTTQGLPAHNGQLVMRDKLLLNESNRDHLMQFSPSDQRELMRVPVPGTWLRGLYPLDPSRILVGTAPAAIAEVELNRGSIMRHVQLSNNPNEAVHGLIAIDG